LYSSTKSRTTKKNKKKVHTNQSVVPNPRFRQGEIISNDASTKAKEPNNTQQQNHKILTSKYDRLGIVLSVFLPFFSHVLWMFYGRKALLKSKQTEMLPARA